MWQMCVKQAGWVGGGGGGVGGGGGGANGSIDAEHGVWHCIVYLWTL